MDIVDSFLFFREFEMLEARCRELDPVVDRFVLIESTHTHAGDPKPLYYSEALEKGELPEGLKPFAEKTKVLVAPPGPGEDPWHRERFSRACLNLELPKLLRKDDVLLHGDLDEIPRPELVRKHAGKKGVFVFEQRFHYYYLNCVDPEYKWFGTRMISARNLKPIQDLRQTPGGTVLLEGGWHLSYMGGKEKIREKLQAFAHQEYNQPEFTDLVKIEQRMNSATDLFERGFKWRYVSKEEALKDLPRLFTEEADGRFKGWFMEPKQNGLPAPERKPEPVEATV